MREHTIERRLKAAIEADGDLCWKLVSPGLDGVPDRICLKDGKVVFVEVKAPGRKLRPLQKRRIRQLTDQGFTVLVIDQPDGIEEVRHALSAA
ncbi:VRR-NUC domain-containing protein [Actinomyces trachealis]|uniref:VRR-NUC domain-containing protein n=1 Tax=Actinomyces trachealis TaxID=2763540 RepID=UPI0018928C33|nr:VRR-NUC domain-containing protein [Actinomyces trachealis]